MTEDAEQNRRRFRPYDWPLWTARACLFGWWALIFTATHIKLDATPGEAPVPDKLIHFVMYAVLGMLLPMWRGWRQRVTRKQGLRYFIIIIIYAILDELLQIPVGRTAEWLDGVADLLGGATGILTATAVRNMLLERFGNQQPTSS